MIRFGISRALLAFALLAGPASAQDKPKPPTPAMLKFEQSLDKQTGDIPIGPAKAVLKLGDAYYFLGAADARRVLVDMWDNPPDAVDGVLGLVLPKDKTSYDNVWGAVITYDASGHVSNDEAAKEDFDAALEAMRSGEEDRNAARKQQGYPASHLVGWAQPPSYDAGQHSLVWARDFRIDGDRNDSLNYDVRLLGRDGVLSLNMVSDMPHLAEVRTAAASFAQTAAFRPGARYADFNASTDKAAGYGLAGLVAAGAGVAVAKKAGLLAIILAFGKKAIALVAVAFAFLWRKIQGLLGRRKEEDWDDEPAADSDREARPPE